MKITMDFKTPYLFFYYFFARHLPVSYRYGIFGKLSKSTRAKLCARIFKKCGENINVEKGVDFGDGTGVQIGDYSGIGINCQIPNSIIIGNYVMMGPEVVIINQNHEFSDISKPMMFQGYRPASPVVIEDDVWIGARAIILPGLRIGKGSIIGAGAVVTTDIEAFSICVGNPARPFKSRLHLDH